MKNNRSIQNLCPTVVDALLVLILCAGLLTSFNLNAGTLVVPSEDSEKHLPFDEKIEQWTQELQIEKDKVKAAEAAALAKDIAEEKAEAEDEDFDEDLDEDTEKPEEKVKANEKSRDQKSPKTKCKNAKT